jgi:hypothetical protein
MADGYIQYMQSTCSVNMELYGFARKEGNRPGAAACRDAVCHKL